MLSNQCVATVHTKGLNSELAGQAEAGSHTLTCLVSQDFSGALKPS